MSKTLMNLVSTSFRHGKTGRGVLTTEQALVRAHVTKTLITVSSRENGVFFFTDDHCFGYPYLANEFVSCTMAFPMHVTPRESLPTGVIETMEQYIGIFHDDEKQITTIEELVTLIDGE